MFPFQDYILEGAYGTSTLAGLVLLLVMKSAALAEGLLTLSSTADWYP